MYIIGSISTAFLLITYTPNGDLLMKTVIPSNYYDMGQAKSFEEVKSKYEKLIVSTEKEIKKEFPEFKDVTIPKTLFLSIIMQESKGNSYAMRYEPKFYDWLQRKVTSEEISPFAKHASRFTELKARATSFGPMQVMGQTARQMGFRGVFLTELTNPEVGLYCGMLYYFQQHQKHGTIEAALSAYNAGTPRLNLQGKYQNQEYVDSVLAHKQRFDLITMDV